jgi:hypothetical protein
MVRDPQSLSRTAGCDGDAHWWVSAVQPTQIVGVVDGMERLAQGCASELKGAVECLGVWCRAPERGCAVSNPKPTGLVVANSPCGCWCERVVEGGPDGGDLSRFEDQRVVSPTLRAGCGCAIVRDS